MAATKQIKTSASTEPAAKPSGLITESEEQKPLLANNFLWVIVAGILIIVGFVLMGGSSSDVDAYNPDIFSTRRIVIGPTLSFLGFVLMAVAIIIKPKPIK